MSKAPIPTAPVASAPANATTLDGPHGSAAGEVAALPFEAALAQLEDIVRQLEGGKVPLEESIAIYERGELLKKHCETLLRRAEARIERITLGPDGAPTGTVPLDPSG